MGKKLTVTLELDVDDNWDGSDDAEEALSDELGYCVKGLVSEWDNPDYIEEEDDTEDGVEYEEEPLTQCEVQNVTVKSVEEVQ